MLEDAVAELKTHGAEAIDAARGWSPLINTGAAVLIPEHYVPDLNVRLALYRRLSEAVRPEDREALAAVKRGDTVVLSSGMIGKVVRVEDAELGLEVAQGVTVKVVKTMVAEVRTRGAPAAANDAKS